MQKNTDKEGFSITISYDKSSEDPAVIFSSISNLIKSLQELDKTLIRSINIEPSATLFIERIEEGSLKIHFINILKASDDNLLAEGEWNKLLGNFLVKCKHHIINWLRDNNNVSDKNKLQTVVDGLYEIAKEEKVSDFKGFNPIKPDQLFFIIVDINNSLQPLEVDDEVTFESKYGKSTISRSILIESENIQETLHERVENKISRMSIKVKKPDYLGYSKWDFYYDNKNINMTISDHGWLEKFHSRSIPLMPGDALNVEALVQTTYDANNNVKSRYYEITKVLEISKGKIQQTIFNKDKENQ